MIDPHSTAFPTQMAVPDGHGNPIFLGAYCQTGSGLSVREYFAAMAMQGILLSDSRCQSSFGASEAASFFEIHAGVGNNQSQAVAWRACHMADALIAELNKPKEPA